MSCQNYPGRPYLQAISTLVGSSGHSHRPPNTPTPNLYAIPYWCRQCSAVLHY